MSFHEVRFPTSVARGASGGPERLTEIVSLVSGHEERNTRWAHSRRRYDAGIGVQTVAQLHDVIAFFEARRGRLYGFRWKDATDYKSSSPEAAISELDQQIGVGDGTSTTFELAKTYLDAGGSYQRPIRKPVAGTVIVAVDGVPEPAATVDTSTGIVTLPGAPAQGAIVSAGFEFDVPVRFDTDRLEVSMSHFEAGHIPNIPVVEVRL